MLRVLNVAILGAIVACFVLTFVTRDFGWADVLLWLLIPGVLLLFVNVASGAGMAPRKPEHLALPLAEREGRLAVGRLLGIRQTGTQVNQQPLCELSIAVMPEDRSAYRTSVRRVIQVIEAASWQPGRALVVIRRSLDRPEVDLVRDPPAEWLARAEAAPAADPPVWEAPSGIRSVLLGKMPWWVYPLGFLVGAGLTVLPLLLG